uniref:Uncharacterized protein n=1 Tax=Cyanophora biloba TaxID=1489483 RepID=A0A873WYL8_9EUKA|nr:hypothetical protein DXZ13_mgp25 [Cyanophora biloba]QPB15037.1 hypothetical protein [Cyanophora biloba]
MFLIILVIYFFIFLFFQILLLYKSFIVIKLINNLWFTKGKKIELLLDRITRACFRPT